MHPVPRRILATLSVVFAAVLLIGFASAICAAEAAEQPKNESRKDSGDWKPLFDGKTLKGWHPIGQGSWTVEDGMIVGRHDPKQDYGHLVTDKSYKDFTVRLKFKCLKGNSGLYFRIAVDPKAFSGVSGFQAEIDPRKDVGGLYETNGRAWVVQPTPDQVKSYFKPDDWNDMTVSAHGGHIIVTINGKTSAEVKDDKGKWREGPFALQVHAGQEGLVYFKDIEVKEE